MAIFFSIPFEIYLVFVTKISSPTTSISLPNLSVNFANPSQSPSDRGSSQRITGYFSSQCEAKSINSSLLIFPLPDQIKSYLLFKPGDNEFAALSIAIDKSIPGLKFAFSIASIINSIASSLLSQLGANPPSSPTLVANPLPFNIFLSA
ncbi:hypothetical protein BMS3Abin04_00005 [bacterium BMS3Abin04]|nr:hypothetical protein BMS3Abin04_00005 [bacterium BMS3Abin04]